MTNDEKERRKRLRSLTHDHLLTTGKLTSLAGMALDTNVIQGDITSWVLRIELKDGVFISYAMDNADDAPVLCDGEEVKL